MPYPPSGLPPDPTLAELEKMIERAFSFRTELSKESDRGCALLAAAYLDDQVRELLSRRLVVAPPASADVFEGSGPLATFSARIDMAFLLGLLAPAVRKDLHLVRKIRNDFAHEPISLEFSSLPIAQRCRELYHRLHEDTRPPRAKFTEATMGILAVLHGAIRMTKPLESPPDVDLNAELKATVRSTAKDLVEELSALAEEDEDAPMRTLKERTLRALRSKAGRSATEKGDSKGNSGPASGAPPSTGKA